MLIIALQLSKAKLDICRSPTYTSAKYQFFHETLTELDINYIREVTKYVHQAFFVIFQLLIILF